MNTFTKEEIAACLKEGRRDFALFTEEERKYAASFPGNEKMRLELFAFAEAEREKPDITPTFRQFVRFDTDGDRDAFEDDRTSGYFLTRHRLAAFFLMVYLYEKDEYLTPLQDTMWAVLNEYSWALPAHMFGRSLTRLETDGFTVDLYASMAAQDLAEILYLLGEKLHPLLKARVKREIGVRVFDVLYGENPREFWWQKTKCNWAAVCGGNVGAAAMYLCDDEYKLAGVLKSVTDTMACFLRGFSDDGVCHEGIGYWTYGFGYFMMFADVLKKRTGGRIDLLDDPKVKKIAAFPVSCLYEGGLSLPFSDAWKFAKVRPGMMNYLSRRFPDLPLPSGDMIKNRFDNYSSERFALDVRDFLWCGREFSEADYPPFVAPYPGAEWYIARAGSGVTFMAKAGNNAETHNHDDIGNFAVCQHGVPLFWDIGAGIYCKQYLTDTWRYEFVESSSRGHSVPIIGGNLQKHGKKKTEDGEIPYAARDTRVTEDGLSCDIAPVYDLPYLEKCLRELRFDTASGDFALSDTYEFTEDGIEVVERFVSVFPPVLIDGGAVIEKDGVKITVKDEGGNTPVLSEEKRITTYGQPADGAPVYFTDFRYPAQKHFRTVFTFTVE